MDYAEILVSLRRIIRAVNLEGKRLEKEHGVSIPQLLCLSFLEQKEGYRATLSEIKNYLKLNASTVTGITTRLEKRGLIARLPTDDKDRRVNYITLTRKGGELVQQMPDILHVQLINKLAQSSPEKLDELRSAFQVIIGFLEIEDIDASPILASNENIATTR